MIYNGSAGDSLIEDISFRTNTDLNQFPLKDRNRYINEAYSRIAYVILKADGRMAWDDPNHTDQPIATTDLVKGQRDYNIFSSTPSALQDWLAVKRIDIFDAGGTGVQLQPMDENDYKGVAESEVDKSPSLPYMFDFNGSIVKLYPAPDYDYTNGMTFWFDRAPSYFSITDTTKRPGFDTRFHQYLSIYAANQWNGMKKKDWSLQTMLNQMELEIGNVYSVQRNKTEVNKLSRLNKPFK